jgi:hypothetical protein
VRGKDTHADIVSTADNGPILTQADAHEYPTPNPNMPICSEDDLSCPASSVVNSSGIDALLVFPNRSILIGTFDAGSPIFFDKCLSMKRLA